MPIYIGVELRAVSKVLFQCVLGRIGGQYETFGSLDLP